MKKLILLATLFVVLGTFQANAQNGGGDPAQREAMMKEMKALNLQVYDLIEYFDQ